MKIKSIPVNALPSELKEGMIIARTSFDGSPNSKEVERSHRDGGYTFILQEQGITHIEIDFKKYEIKSPSVIYIHPDQVHRVISFENAIISSWIITVENIRPEYLKILEELTPVKVLSLSEEVFSNLKETVSLCVKFFESKNEKLYSSILKESCNALLVFVASQYLADSKPIDNSSRFETITKSFKTLLELHFTTIKSPSEYADKLNISTAYLNECVKTATGHSVSRVIQQRIVLEAKRLLHHSDKSVKEIALELGYDDYSYFTRLFSKAVNMTPSAFRNKNLE
ncbi:AraC family transcriptional regulator [Flavobacterium zhairuonense]|uniref:AraC family transcriptional regulator n=1 Tax=Flavobacterium zhairuonense TaxID=2493631 RepID=UPI00104F970F|nr:helix-turn-helix domain-containing protein [Flavobacterium zhairuonense]KAF2514769.1 AraC family transcriptional regulator [Flavobacterium zhairuonense]